VSLGGQTSVGKFTIEKKGSAYVASGNWKASVSDVPAFGTVTVTFPITNAPVTIENGILTFTATGKATESTKLMGSSGFTLEVFDGTFTSCSYRMKVSSQKWIDLWTDVMGATGEYLYSGDTSVTIVK